MAKAQLLSPGAARAKAVVKRPVRSKKRRSKPAVAKRSAGTKRAARPAKHHLRPGPGTFVDGRFKCPAGALAYKLYTPIGSTRRRMPLVVMLHGCTQTAADFAAGTGMNALADELGFLVLYPEQSAAANMARCWNWFRPENQRRGSGEAAVIAGMTADAILTGKANPARVYIAGLSAGGAAASNIAASYPEIFVAVGVHSSLASGNIASAGAAISAMKKGGSMGIDPERGRMIPVPTIVFQGDLDRSVHPSSVEGFVRALRRSSPRLVLIRTQHVPSGSARAYTRTLYRKDRGQPLLEVWTVHGTGHAWSGSSTRGSFTDPAGPNASRAMLRFFLARKHPPRKVPAKVAPGKRLRQHSAAPRRRTPLRSASK